MADGIKSDSKMFMLMLRGITPNLGHIAMPDDEYIDDLLRPWRDLLIEDCTLLGEWIFDFTSGVKVDALADEVVSRMWLPMEGEIAFRAYIVLADSVDRVTALAQSCPHLDMNGTVEVLPISEAPTVS